MLSTSAQFRGPRVPHGVTYDSPEETFLAVLSTKSAAGDSEDTNGRRALRGEIGTAKHYSRWVKERLSALESQRKGVGLACTKLGRFNSKVGPV